MVPETWLAGFGLVAQQQWVHGHRGHAAGGRQSLQRHHRRRVGIVDDGWIRTWNHWKMLAAIWGVSKNRGSPKWMVKIMKTLLEWDDLGVPLFFGNTHLSIWDRFSRKSSGFRPLIVLPGFWLVNVRSDHKKCFCLAVLWPCARVNHPSKGMVLLAIKKRSGIHSFTPVDEKKQSSDRFEALKTKRSCLRHETWGF